MIHKMLLGAAILIGGAVAISAILRRGRRRESEPGEAPGEVGPDDSGGPGDSRPDGNRPDGNRPDEHRPDGKLSADAQ